MMMKYGMEGSWAILHRFGPIDGLCPLGIPNDHQIFFCDDREQLISLEFEDCKIREYGIQGAPILYQNLPSIHKSMGLQNMLKH